MILRLSFALLVIALATLLPKAASSQNWTSDEQSLIDAIDHCWDRAMYDGSIEAFMDVCRPTEATIYWWTPETAPINVVSSWMDGLWANWNLSLLSQDLRPIRVQIDGDFGFIYFHGIRLWELDDGTRETQSWKGFEVWKRTAQGWSFHGGSGTPDTINQID